MNIVAVRETDDGYAIDHVVETASGEQIWTSFVARGSHLVTEWIAAGGEVV